MRLPTRASVVVTALLVAAGVAAGPSATAGTRTAVAWSPSDSYTAHADQPSMQMYFPLTCESSDAQGDTSATGAVAYVDALSFDDCAMTGLAVDLVDVSTSVRAFDLGPSASNPDTNDVLIEDVGIHVGGFGCGVDLEGSLHGYFDNTTGDLVIDDDLTAFNADCLGLVSDYDLVPFNATYHITG
ncbi:hypothetical protein FKN01_11885 [Streptomyces sp. 130]|uniref:hypothetical protein n=1 Tax=Streptomyces sp. 130 TaxID=2591006 RepID=UPI001180C879|nr:hypothetical protein [Streptomyces sp. 130]TRV78879.1 hypothetical protein FKN01_11885 [Streptomyces sp. 130]